VRVYCRRRDGALHAALQLAFANWGEHAHGVRALHHLKLTGLAQNMDQL
jgi:hypothetical protein